MNREALMLGVSKREESMTEDKIFLEDSQNFLELFREQAESNSESVIVVAGSRSVTYGELDRKSDALAKYLRTVGVKTEQPVGLCSSLSADFIVCMLGILKAGGVYFPIDPMYPRERLQYMLDDGKPCVILAEAQYGDLFQNEKIIKIEDKIFQFENKNELEDLSVNGENLAYVVYTSGSTGNPKGIMVAHKSLPNIALAHREYYPSNMRMLISGGVCFDATLLVIFHALINNDPLYLFNYNPREDTVDTLLEFIEENSISYMICIPSQYLRLLQKNHKFEHLKCVSLTGENLPSSLCSLHARFAPNALMYNEYGPTECAIGTTIAKIYDPESATIHQVTVGKPLRHTQVYILDENLQKVGTGAKGEIYIGGIGLARGYLNKEELTNEKFVSVTMEGEKLTRLYRTGDVGRFLPNGELEFLGRVDSDIHICGRQMNLGEIEFHISHCPSILESVVMIRTNPQGEENLVAYVTSLKKGVAKHSLLEYLKGFLPKHMIPSDVFEVDQFPLSPNGKIDREILVQRDI
jgi:amino acid adenylation domain-containing protein